LGCYKAIAKALGIGALERAVGLAKEDPKVKNKGAYVVKICKNRGFKTKEKNLPYVASLKA